MRIVDVEISAVVTFNQSMSVTDEEADFLKNHEGFSASIYREKDKELYSFLERRLDFDCISEIRDLDLEIVDIQDEEEEEDDSN